MFRPIALLAFCCWLGFESPVRAEDWATKMFDETRYDFGKVARSAKVEHYFKFKNPYVEDVHVASVRTSCGCTTPRVSQETVKTYGEAAIIAHFNTDQFVGQRSATLTVIIDKPFYAEVQLNVAGYIRQDIILNPPFVDFNTLDVGQSAERTLELSYAGRSDWRVLGVKSGRSFLEAEAVEVSRANGQVRYQLKVQLKPGAPSGYLNEQIVLQTSDAAAPELPIGVEGRLETSLTVSPSSLFLGVLQPGQKVTKQIVVQGKQPFKITEVVASDKNFEFKTGDVAKKVHLVPIVFTAGSEPGNVNYRIQISTDLGSDVVGEIAAYAQINGPSTTAQAAPTK
ncbi:MAG: DUF1573 domain-containing protein [Planctomycetia bacterium]|nr:DUF1573 domain-containing protein [Planctomycetia bacterium]